MNEKAVKQDFGKAQKIVKAVKKIASKELLWLLFVLLISIPTALVISYVISSDAHILNEEVYRDIEEVSEIITHEQPLFRVVFGICVVGLYFSRMVVSAIKNSLEDKK